MPTFPLTFPHAGLTFTVMAGGRGMASIPPGSGQGAMMENGMYIRVSGHPGLEDFGLVRPSETNDALARRIGEWWDEKHPAKPTYTIERTPSPPTYTPEDPPAKPDIKPERRPT